MTPASTGDAATAPVLFVSHSPQFSGAEKVMVDLADECHRRGIDVAIACPSGPLSASFGAHITHIEIPHLGRDHALSSKVAVVASMAGGYLRAARILRAHRHRRCVANSAHTLPVLRMAGFRTVSWLVHDHVVDSRFRLFIRIGAPAIARSVAVSPTTADAVRALVPAIVTGRLGVDIPDRMPDATSTGPTRVGTLSVITPWKGVDVFLEAMALLPEVSVVVAGEAFPGDVDYADGLRRRATEPDLAGRVEFPGRVPAETLREWSVHVSASVKPEAGPLTVLEAMAAGVPVVATDHGGPRRFLADDRGVLVRPADAAALADGVTSVLADHARTATMVERAFAYVSANHDRRETIPALLDLLVTPSMSGDRS